MFDSIISALVHFADSTGYIGIYGYMFLVGTFIPVPSEIMLIPAGYLASIGQKSFALAMISGALGSLSGAMFNYVFAKFVVRKFMRDKPILEKVEKFFARHGIISIILAPLTPGLGQYMSIPAGLSHMPLRWFIPLTFAGNLTWVGFILLIGYQFGTGAQANHSAGLFSLVLLAVVIVVASIYVWREIKKTNAKED
jgi:membrane protein DedA with SNARE-associated domain